MAYTGAFVDDTETDQIYAGLLSSSGENPLTFSYWPVSDASELAGKLFASSLDIVAIDFRLDENPDMVAPGHAYKGSALAQLLRDRAVDDPARDFPIVLVTAEVKMKTMYSRDRTAHDLFDKVYTKERVSGPQKAQTRKELLALCEGYKSLKACILTGDRLTIFELPAAEREFVDHQELRSVLEEAEAPHIAAGFILREVIDRTGLLLSDNEVAARLGLEPSGVDRFAPLLTKFGLHYRGIFSQGWRRWWAHRFDFWAEEFFGCRPTRLTGTERAGKLNEHFSLGLTAALSTWNPALYEKFSFACASCNKPASVHYSLEAYDPRVPIFGQPRRICWDCIQTGSYRAKSLKVSDADLNLVQEVERADRDKVEQEDAE